MDWVTCPEVIQLLVSGGGLRVRDEVKLQNCYNIFIGELSDGDVVTVDELNALSHRHNWRDDDGTDAGSEPQA
jgi:hypothetical protein